MESLSDRAEGNQPVLCGVYLAVVRSDPVVMREGVDQPRHVEGEDVPCAACYGERDEGVLTPTPIRDDSWH